MCWISAECSVCQSVLKMLQPQILDLSVRPITKPKAKRIVEAKHYSGCLGIFWEGFGLFQGNRILGVCCFGQPSPPLQKYAFTDRDFRLYELTRLVVDRGIKNGASTLIGRSLVQLKNQPCAVVSYADSSHGHCGIVYQSTNWRYTGPTVSHDCLYMVDGVLTHPMTIRDRFKTNSPTKWAKENGVEKVKPEPKHRYFFFCGSKRQRKSMTKRLSYPEVIPYPQINKQMYEDGIVCSKI